MSDDSFTTLKTSRLSDITNDISISKMKLTLTNKLIQAIMSGSQRKIHRLLDRGVHINSKNDFGFGALVAALHVEDEKKRKRLFHFLLDHGASYTARDERHDRSVLLWACVMGRNDQVRVLLEETGGDISLNDKDLEGNTAMHHAVLTGNLPLVEILTNGHLRFGVSVDVEDKLGFTPYLLARRLGHKHIAAHLNTKGLASVGHGDLQFRSPREWSQIGKFERRKAAAFRIEDTINTARIQGKSALLPNSSVTSRTCASLPTLKEHEHATGELTHSNDNTLFQEHQSRLKQVEPDNSKPVKLVCIPNSSDNTGKLSDNIKYIADVSNRDSAHDFMPINRAVRNLNELFPLKNEATGKYNFSDALSLLEQTSLTRGRAVSHFRPSELDESKKSEYRHILGSIGVFMNMLAEQNTKSFRSSVKVIKPEESPKGDDKKKVSTFAALFGSRSDTRRRNRSLIKSMSTAKKEKQKIKGTLF
ncbi:hypothetical protein Btru_069035 [Bulinus truncatus]|nr:hypothetical protein Btru_069035 [Bulinus truncatus]